MLSRYSLAAMALLASGNVLASDLFDGRLTLRGFGTLGLTHNSAADAGYIRDITQPDGPAGTWSSHVDTRLGLQVNWRVTDQLTAVVQGLSRYNYEGRYDPALSWAFLRYSPDPAVQLRLGRVGLDTYMLADSRDVGYSYLWARPPVDYYGNRHFSHIDGGDITLTRPLGNGLLWGKLYAGEADEKVPSALGDGAVFDAGGSKVYGGHINYEWNSWRVQLGATKVRHQLKASDSYMQDLAQLELYCPVMPDCDPALPGYIRSTFEPTDTYITSLGVAYDRGPLQIQAMLSHLDRPGDETDVDAGFVSVGYRIRSFTPYVMLSGSRTEGFAYRDIGVDQDGAAGLTQQTFSIGARYDLAQNLALKTQLDYLNADQTGLLARNIDPDWDGKATIFSINLDFIF